MASQFLSKSAGQNFSICNPNPWMNQQFNTSSSCRNQQQQNSQTANQGSSLTPISKLEVILPKFDGHNPEDWIVTAEIYFSHYEIPNYARIQQCSRHFESTAIVWFYEMFHEFDSWDNFKTPLLKRFGPSRFEDIARELANIRQVGCVSEYISKFEKLSGQIHGLCEPFLLNLFLSGLKPEIKRDMLGNRPGNMSQAIDRTKSYESEMSDTSQLYVSESVCASANEDLLSKSFETVIQESLVTEGENSKEFKLFVEIPIVDTPEVYEEMPVMTVQCASEIESVTIKTLLPEHCNLETLDIEDPATSAYMTIEDPKGYACTFTPKDFVADSSNLKFALSIHPLPRRNFLNGSASKVMKEFPRRVTSNNITEIWDPGGFLIQVTTNSGHNETMCVTDAYSANMYLSLRNLMLEKIFKTRMVYNFGFQQTDLGGTTDDLLFGSAEKHQQIIVMWGEEIAQKESHEDPSYTAGDVDDILQAVVARVWDPGGFWNPVASCNLGTDIALFQFLAILFHENNTSLYGVLSMLHLLMDIDPDITQQDVVRSGQGSEQLLVSLVDEVLGQAKLLSFKVERESRQLFSEILLVESLVCNQNFQSTEEVPRCFSAILMRDTGIHRNHFRHYRARNFPVLQNYLQNFSPVETVRYQGSIDKHATEAKRGPPPSQG